REHLHRQLFVKVDAAHRFLVAGEIMLLHRLDFHGGQLSIRQVEAGLLFSGGGARRIGMGATCAWSTWSTLGGPSEMRSPVEHDDEHEQGGGNRRTRATIDRASCHGGSAQTFRNCAKCGDNAISRPRGLLSLITGGLD